VIRTLLARSGMLIRIKRVYYSIESRLHLPRTRALFSHVCGPESLVFDVGANLGQKTTIFLSIGARVVAIEPETACFDYLTRHFRSERLTLVNAAVSDQPGAVRLTVNPQTPEISSADADWLTSGPDHEKAGDTEEQIVEALTLTQLIERFGMPDYIKIDVEGFETRVLSGLRAPVRHVSFEFHAVNVAELQERCAILDALGRYSFNYTLGNSYELSLERWIPSAQLIAAIQSLPATATRWGDVFARRREESAISLHDE
jgi:FkbM family methyltransferase